MLSKMKERGEDATVTRGGGGGGGDRRNEREGE